MYQLHFEVSYDNPNDWRDLLPLTALFRYNSTISKKNADGKIWYNERTYLKHYETATWQQKIFINIFIPWDYMPHLKKRTLSNKADIFHLLSYSMREEIILANFSRIITEIYFEKEGFN